MPEGGHPPLGQRLSAPPLTQPPSPFPITRAHLAPPSPCLSVHSAGCPVHQPCPVHTPCPSRSSCPSHSPCPSRSSCPSRSPCPSHSSRTCPHGCPEGHPDYDWTDSDSENDDNSDLEDSDYEEEEKGNLKIAKTGVSSCFRKIRQKIEEIVESKYFMQGILVCILINTLSMGIEFHGQVRQVIISLYLLNSECANLICIRIAVRPCVYLLAR